MIDLRNYKEQIRAEVQKVNELDQNWKWSVRSVSKTLARIHWSYLEGEKKECFYLRIEKDRDGPGHWLWARMPDGVMIEGWLVFEGEPPSPRIGFDIAKGICWAVESIAFTARNEY